jgi:hypothetical protein
VIVGDLFAITDGLCHVGDRGGLVGNGLALSRTD